MGDEGYNAEHFEKRDQKISHSRAILRIAKQILCIIWIHFSFQIQI